MDFGIKTNPVLFTSSLGLVGCGAREAGRLMLSSFINDSSAFWVQQWGWMVCLSGMNKVLVVLLPSVTLVLSEGVVQSCGGDPWRGLGVVLTSWFPVSPVRGGRSL